MRYFNTEGPVDPDEHYCIDPLERVNLAEILTLIARKKYFVLHAPRQTGKTSVLLSLQDRLNAAGEYRCLYVNFEEGQAGGEDTARAMQALLGQLASRALDVLRDAFVDRTRSECLRKDGSDRALGETLVRWSRASPKPLVLLIDEIDSLVGATLISVLRQLRANYDRRPRQFPQSVVLCGVRDVRDYRIYSGREGTHVQGGSAFIKATSLRLGDFSECDVRDLLAQHTAERGTALERGVAERIWTLTCGQPWLVNALASEACFDSKTGRDRSGPIRGDTVDLARETLIDRRVTHLDQLADKLREDRVRRVILPMLAGSGDWDYSFRDLEYVRDLGLVARGGGAAAGAAGVPAASREQRRSDREGIRGRARSRGSAGGVAAGRRAEPGAHPQVRDRVQGAYRKVRSGSTDPRGAGTDSLLHGPLRGGIGTPGDP